MTREQVREQTGWPVRFRPQVSETPPPTAARSSTPARSARADGGARTDGARAHRDAVERRRRRSAGSAAQPPLNYPGYRSTRAARAVAAADRSARSTLSRHHRRRSTAGGRTGEHRQRPDPAARRGAAGRAHHRRGPRARRGRPAGAGRLVEIWQANAAGRYRHAATIIRRRSIRTSPAPAATHHRRRRPLPVHDDQARRLPVAQSPQRLAAGAHPFLAVRPQLPHAGWSRRCTSPATRCSRYDPIFQSIPDERARERLVSRFDLSLTEAGVGARLRFDIVVRGDRRHAVRGRRDERRPRRRRSSPPRRRPSVRSSISA